MPHTGEKAKVTGLSQPPGPREALGLRLRLVAVERAVQELRRGLPVLLTCEDKAQLVAAAELADDALADLMEALGNGSIRLHLTARRAETLGFSPDGGQGVTLTARPGARLSPIRLTALADPANPQTSGPPEGFDVQPLDPLGAAGLMLAKLAGLLPASLSVPLDADQTAEVRAQGLLEVSREQIERFEEEAVALLSATGSGLDRITGARVPLADAENTRIEAFRPKGPLGGGPEHLALIIGQPDPDKPVLVRLHSECFTGDLIGSLKCDCGEQLRGAIAVIEEQGSGILLYLSQEGRGIGLMNKLRAYALQDQGFDTVDANLHLGFEADERLFEPAAEILRQLGISKVRLLTNNPQKVEGLEKCGITVTERVTHAFPTNRHNERYLETKASKAGHLFD